MTLLRIATFNLENLDEAPREGPALKDRIPVLAARLEELAADVLCLQEVSARRSGGARKGERGFNALDALLRATRYADYQRCNSLHRDGHGPMDVQNLVIVSRYPIQESRQYWHDYIDPPAHRLATAMPIEPTPWPVRWDRPVLHATVGLPDQRGLNVLNLHLRAPTAVFIPGQKLDPARWRTASG